MDWLEYDKQYRWERSKESKVQDWSVIKQHVLNNILMDRVAKPQTFRGNKQSTTTSASTAKTQSQSKQSIGFVPKGFCFQYHNKGKYCPPGAQCTFRHDCPSYGAGHPAYTCTQPPKKRYNLQYANAQEMYQSNIFQQGGQYRFPSPHTTQFY